MTGRALILAAHGSRHAPQVNERIANWADRLAAITDFDTVAACFHQGSPTFSGVLDAIAESDVTVVPVMNSRGYYANHVLPGELARNRRHGATRVRITEPVGTHPGMTQLARQRIHELCEAHGLPESSVTVVIVGHGTPRHEHSRRAASDLASRLGYLTSAQQVFAVFIDDEPGVQAIAERAAADTVIVLPFLIGAGPHAALDIPHRLGMSAGEGALPRAERVGHRLMICDRPVGEHEAVLDIIADLARGVVPSPAPFLPRRALRIGTRASKLALWQANHVAAQLTARGHDVDIVALSTLGDRDRDRAIADLPSDAPFADDLERALALGEIDLAVHSHKDVAVAPSVEFTNAAVPPRGDAREALVSRENLTLDELPTGAVVGTSSPRRAAQVRMHRPDLVVRNIRGPVDERVRKVRSREFDAAILAYAGLDRLGLVHEIVEVFAVERFVPAPAQAALLVQVRAGDEYATSVAQALDDRATRTATTLELDVLRAIPKQSHVTVAAYSSVDAEIRLLVRLATVDGAMVRDVVRTGKNTDDVLNQTLEEIHTLLPEFAVEMSR